MSCSDADPKERQARYSALGTGVKCLYLTHNNTLTGCDHGVKEIINATNIILYE